jgi:hypothetical protein
MKVVITDLEKGKLIQCEECDPPDFHRCGENATSRHRVSGPRKGSAPWFYCDDHTEALLKGSYRALDYTIDDRRKR